MSRNASDTRRESHAGFTLVEVAVVLCLSGLLVGALAYFFKSFGRTFNVQEQITDRDLNAHYTVKRLSETLMAAGANLPSKGWEIVSLPDGNPASRVRLAINPRGGIQFAAVAFSGADLEVDDGKGFAKASSVLIVPEADANPPFKVSIDAGFNANGFSKGVKPNGSGAILRLASSVNLQPGDAIYAYAEEEYRLVGSNLMLGNMVLAENIESLTISFLTAAQVTTTQWSAMRSARVQVRARTRMPDPGLKKDGGYRRLELSTDVLLRNRI
jgi:hypothetical protein